MLEPTTPQLFESNGRELDDVVSAELNKGAFGSW